MSLLPSNLSVAERRLAGFVLLALMAHGALLFAVRLPSPSMSGGRMHTLEVELFERPVPVPRAAMEMRVGTLASVPTRRAQRSTQPAATTKQLVEKATVSGAVEEPSVALGNLLQVVRWIARDEAHRSERVRQSLDGPAIDTPEAKLARALRPPLPGEKHLNGDLLKITTATGASYCLKAPPNAVRGGLVEPLAVPTTCP